MSWQPKALLPPAGYRYGPRYRPSRQNIVRAVAYIVLGKQRPLARDAFLAVPDMPRPPCVRGADRIPEGGPCVVVANHYERPGLWMVWPALFLGALIWQRMGQDIHWIAIEEWESFSLWGIPVPPSLTRRVFARAFATYGIRAMPPPQAPAGRRAAALRGAAAMVQRGEVVGLMPEGDVGPTPELLGAREGVGAFLLLLTASGAPLLPIGLYEEEDRLVAQVGEPFSLAAPLHLGKEERDGWARDRVMAAIRDLLPTPLWGVYR